MSPPRPRFRHSLLEKPNSSFFLSPLHETCSALSGPSRPSPSPPCSETSARAACGRGRFLAKLDFQRETSRYSDFSNYSLNDFPSEFLWPSLQVSLSGVEDKGTVPGLLPTSWMNLTSFSSVLPVFTLPYFLGDFAHLSLATVSNESFIFAIMFLIFKKFCANVL